MNMFRLPSLLLVLAVAFCGLKNVHALSPTHLTPPKHTGSHLLSRSDALRAGLLTMSTLVMGPSVVEAAEEKTIYITGKTPKVPGAKPKDKNDTSGTRKDPNFLRSIADCKSQCESKGKTQG